jgi:hypothetical protein
MAEGAVARESSAITNGKVDTTHPAVMLESCDKPCICTGTVVKTDATLGVGWVLTAAHCIPDPTDTVHVRFYVQGDKAATFSANYANTIDPGAIRYPIVEAARHPQYDPNGAISFDGKQPYDVGVIRIVGVGKDTPAIPIGPAQDGLASNASVVSVGYGSTGAWNDETNLGEAGTRHSASVSVSALSSDYITVSGKDPGGFVNIGDSGGPVLATVGGSERVVGVHSIGVDNAFLSVRQSTRVSADLTWIEGELGKPPTASGCNACFTSETGGVRSCATALRACLDQSECNGYALCIQNCGSTGPTQACRDQCKGTNPSGASLFEPVLACGCQACAAKCGGVCPDEYLHPAATPSNPDAGASAAPSDGGPIHEGARPSAETGCSVTRAPVTSSPLSALIALWVLVQCRKRSRAS